MHGDEGVERVVAASQKIAADRDDVDPELYRGRGDVKYPMGFSSDRFVEGNKVHLTLCFNPSHLEAVDPVVEGRTRAEQTDRSSRSGVRSCP